MEDKKTEDRSQREIGELLELFPRVKPEEVPREVWEQVRGGRSLALAYCFYQLRETRRELAQLRGKTLSTGSVSTAGTNEPGSLAAYWDAYEI